MQIVTDLCSIVKASNPHAQTRPEPSSGNMYTIYIIIDVTVNSPSIYVTGNLCNQAFRVLPEIFRHFA